MEKLKQNYIIQAWLVMLLALFFGSSLASVQIVLSPKIKQNKINETLQKIPDLIPGPSQKEKSGEEPQLDIIPKRIEVSKNGRKKFYNVFQASRNGHPAGWVVKSSGQGYADRIELLIGFDPLVNAITGLFILEQKETPGLGNKIIEKEWTNQFLQKKTDQKIAAVKTNAAALNEINAITGATISSKSVCTIINNTVSDLKEELNQKDNIQNKGKL
ncbi:MAG: FMN-binding protein [Deltaproteobacteria bacterium]|nr:FMN-binding protein [Deltaproteobacteria bacterium]